MKATQTMYILKRMANNLLSLKRIEIFKISAKGILQRIVIPDNMSSAILLALNISQRVCPGKWISGDLTCMW